MGWVERFKAVMVVGVMVAGVATAQPQYAAIVPADSQAIPIGPVPHPPGFGFRNLAGGARLRGDRVVVADYGRYHLSAPPRGYEWVQSRGHFVLITINTGIIANIVVASD